MRNNGHTHTMRPPPPQHNNGSMRPHGSSLLLPDRNRRRPPSPPESSASGSASAASAELVKKSRHRTRCLITLGLLLPVVAAVIGVVAWAVSAEVILLPGRHGNKPESLSLQGPSDHIHYMDDRNDLSYGHSGHNVAIKGPNDYYSPYDQQQHQPMHNQNTQYVQTHTGQGQNIGGPSASEVNRFLSKIVSSSKDSNGQSPPFVVIAPAPDQKSASQFDATSNQEPNRYGEEPGAPPGLPPMEDNQQNQNNEGHQMQDFMNDPNKQPPPPPPQTQPTFLPPPPPPPPPGPPPQQNFIISAPIMQRSEGHMPPPPHQHQHQQAQPRFFPPPPPPPHNQPQHHYPPLPPPPPPIQNHQQGQAYDSNRWGQAESGQSGPWESQPSSPQKGVTITIGGQPAYGGGGGHGGSSHVSPLGLMKSLFLPFLPKPKVNLNGRVVFGVVLEKGVGLGGNKQSSNGGGLGIQSVPVSYGGHHH